VAAALAIQPIVAEGQFSAGIGRSFTMGDFSDEAKTGWIGQVGYEFPVAALPFRLRTDVLYADHRNVEREPSLWTRVGGEWFRQIGGALSATQSLPLGAVEPYGLLGVGVIREWWGDYSHAGTDHWNFRLNAGVGLTLPIAGSGGLFVEVRPLLLGKALPLSRPAVHNEARFQTVPVLIGFRL
jgi:hypothetical protein